MKQQKKQVGITLFYSYTSADSKWCDQLTIHLSQLKRDGLIEEWRDQQILAGANRSQAIDQAIHSAQIILLFISADFLASDYCYDMEMQRALERHRNGKVRVIPVILRPCDWQHPPLKDLQCLPYDGQPVTQWQDQDAAFESITQSLRKVIETLSPPAASVSRAALPEIWNVPYPQNTFFTGRDEILTQLRMQLRTGQSMAISQPPLAMSGLGGIGKTQIAVEYAYRFGHEYQAVLWARAESREMLVSSYIELATLLRLSEREVREQDITVPKSRSLEQDTIVQAVKTWFHTHRDWLLILDNADELAFVPAFLPLILGGHLLLTTRAQAMGRLANRIEVKTFSPEQGALFLLKRAGILTQEASLAQATPNDRERAIQISQNLGGLPLALDQAGAYLEEMGCSFLEYQHLYQQHRAALLGERRGLVDDHPPVATTWSLTFQKVEEENPAAADLLRLCAFLQPDSIPEEIILEGGDPLGPHLQTLAANPLTFHEAVRTLRSYSLLQRSAEGHLLSVHRLIQAVLQEAMPEQERALWRRRVLQGLHAVFPEVKYETWNQCKRLVPHVLLCATETKEQQESLELATILGKAADYLRERDQYEQAEPLYQRALHIQEHILGPEDPQVASLLSGLASLYSSQHKNEQAEHLLKQVLDIRERTLEPVHPQVASSLRSLALVYIYQGKHEQAEPLFQRARRICEQVWGLEHPETALVLNGLANLYWRQGKYEQAELLCRRAVHIREQMLGTEHPDVAGQV